MEAMRGWSSSLLAARCRASRAVGHGLQAERNPRAEGPTEVLLLCHRGKSPTLGLSKNVRFSLVRQPPQPLSRDAGLRGAASHHAASLAPTVFPRSVPPGQAGGEACLPSEMHRPRCRGGCKAKSRSVPGSVLPTER